MKLFRFLPPRWVRIAFLILAAASTLEGLKHVFEFSEGILYGTGIVIELLIAQYAHKKEGKH